VGQRGRARAVAEARIVLTFDRDFGELLHRRAAPAPPGVVYLRFRPAHPEEPAERLLALLAAGDVALEGRLTVLERGRVRQRALP
jgi:predicted nuclease of predicted toxin-antitoxin system